MPCLALMVSKATRCNPTESLGALHRLQNCMFGSRVRAALSCSKAQWVSHCRQGTTMRWEWLLTRPRTSVPMTW